MDIRGHSCEKELISETHYDIFYQVIFLLLLNQFSHFFIIRPSQPDELEVAGAAGTESVPVVTFGFGGFTTLSCGLRLTVVVEVLVVVVVVLRRITTSCADSAIDGSRSTIKQKNLK